MNFSIAFSRIVFLVFPGILASLIYGKLKGKGSRKDWEDFMEILIFTVLSYGTYALVQKVFHGFGGEASIVFLDALFHDERPIAVEEIAWASLIGMGYAFLASKAYTDHWLFRFARFLGVSMRYNEGDVWSHFNSSPVGAQWLYVRDHKLDRIYFGWIYGYSESEKTRELWLKDVRVYDNQTGLDLYELQDVMFSRDAYELTLELPKLEGQNTE